MKKSFCVIGINDIGLIWDRETNSFVPLTDKPIKEQEFVNKFCFVSSKEAISKCKELFKEGYRNVEVREGEIDIPSLEVT